MQRAEHIVWRRVSDDACLLLDLKSGHYFSLNKTGVRIWELIEKRAPKSQIAGVLGTEYAISEGQASADVDSFVSTLVEKGLLVEGSDGSPAVVDSIADCGQIGVYEAPSLREHEALQAVTGSSTTSGYSYQYSYYYYYYY